MKKILTIVFLTLCCNLALQAKGPVEASKPEAERNHNKPEMCGKHPECPGH